jgi:lysophospholipase L1-like esterase
MASIGPVWPLAFAAILGLTVSTVRDAKAVCVLKSGDRVVCYGDSITEQRLYTRYIQEYIHCRYPDLKVRFFNAGWGGDTAEGASKRLDRDVLSLHPTVVTLFFGMNDGGYAPVNDATVQHYTTNLENIIERLQANKVRVIVFTPGCVDYDVAPRLKDVDYNTTLAALSKAATNLAIKHDCAYVDVHDPMLEYQTRGKERDPKFTITQDGIHPTPQGHLVMTHLMLQGFGAEPMPALGSMDVMTAKGTNFALEKPEKGVYVLQSTAPNLVPFWYDSDSQSTMTNSGFADFANPRLVVTGLPGSRYDVSVDGNSAGQFSSADLAAGILLPGTHSKAGQMVHDIIYRKENIYFTAWREVDLQLGKIPGVSKSVSDLMAANDALDDAIDASSRPSGKTIVTLKELPSGVNLAKGKPYVASDPNPFNWGIGGLTDGSWEPNSTHCFATGVKDEFPKTATIDLQNASQVSQVLVGVPSFGATKTVAVSVSEDGNTFHEVGRHQFAGGVGDLFVYRFAPVNARYVRLSYLDHYTEGYGYPPQFMFTTECEVYGAQ